MASKCVRFIWAALIVAFLLEVKMGHAQMTMPGMAMMENSVGYLSAGTSIQPKTTSEFIPLLQTSFGNWGFMFHGNGFLVETQQTGPRGGDKLFSTNWIMPMISRDFG